MEEIIIKGKNEEIINSIMKNNNVRIAKIKRKVSKKTLYLLIKFTRVEKIYFPEGILKQMPKGTKEALEETGIEVIIDKRGRGRERKRNYEIIEEYKRKGKKTAEIQKETGIPKRTIYYYLKKKT